MRSLRVSVDDRPTICAPAPQRSTRVTRKRASQPRRTQANDRMRLIRGGIAALGVAGLPSAPVEAVVALSIVAIGVEIVRHARGHGGLTSQWPWAVAFGFGLLHGFGFAGALSEIGLPQDARIPALLLFNVGVEAGQLMVVAALLLPVIWMRKCEVPLGPQLTTAAGYLIGTAGAFWLIQRVAAAWVAASAA